MIEDKLEKLKTLQERLDQLTIKITRLIEAIEGDSLKKVMKYYESTINVDEEDTYSFEKDVIRRVQHILNSNY